MSSMLLFLFLWCMNGSHIVWIEFKDDAFQQLVNVIRAQFLVKKEFDFLLMNQYGFLLDGAVEKSEINEIFGHSPNIEYFIERDQKIKLSSSIQLVNQTNVDNWGLRRVVERKLPLAENFIYPQDAGINSTVYVLDTGILSQHWEFLLPNCTSRVRIGTSIINPNFDPNDFSQQDWNGHGTFVASQIAGLTFGIAKNASLVSVQVLDQNGEGNISDLISGLQWTMKDAQQLKLLNGKAIINLSFGAGRSQALNRVVDGLAQNGLVVVTAAGNDGIDACLVSPGSASSTINVGSSNQFDEMSFFSNNGLCIDVFAPGEDVTGAFINQTTEMYCNQPLFNISGNMSGTSFSSPLVVGILTTLQSLQSPGGGNQYVSNFKKQFLNQCTKNQLKQLKGFRTPNLLAYAEYLD